MGLNRTIIDVLMHGNRELFHSAMIAWLLRPDAEHGMGKALLDRLAAHLPDGSRARRFLAGPVESIATEQRAGRNRYDIVIQCGESQVILENKTKSVGDQLQLEAYDDEHSAVVGLGFCPASFAPEVSSKFPVLTYGVIAEILKTSTPPSSDWGVLVRHYRSFLERELGLHDAMIDCYRDGERDRDIGILAAVDGIAQNDLRFLHYAFLEYLRRYLGQQPVWANVVWESDKNMRSGVWLANFPDPIGPTRYSFSSPIEVFRQATDASLWFHVELNDGIGTPTWAGRAGMLQLKCHSKLKPPDQVRSELKKVFTPDASNGEHWSRKTKRTANTYYLVRKDLKKEDLVFSNLEASLRSFMTRFGRFV